MTVLSNVVLLLKAQKSGDSVDDKYEKILNENGFKVEELKTIVFKFVNLNSLKNKLNDPDTYQGIIFSSPRCVEAVKKALNKEKLLDQWKDKLNYVVGESTYKVASDVLGLNCKGSDSGNGDVLSDIIIEDIKAIIPNCKSFLMPCGNLKTETIESRLKQNSLMVDLVVVYETISNPNLENEVIALTNHFKNVPAFIVFFSPSGVKAFSQCLEKIEDLDDIKFVSIGPTTSKAIEEAGLLVHSVAKKPTPEELLIAIKL